MLRLHMDMTDGELAMVVVTEVSSSNFFSVWSKSTDAHRLKCSLRRVSLVVVDVRLDFVLKTIPGIRVQYNLLQLSRLILVTVFVLDALGVIVGVAVALTVVHEVRLVT